MKQELITAIVIFNESRHITKKSFEKSWGPDLYVINEQKVTHKSGQKGILFVVKGRKSIIEELIGLYGLNVCRVGDDTLLIDFLFKIEEP